jgi:cytochrome oxidase Cu insertion factor (SCO1/SenC/PrrC family)
MLKKFKIYATKIEYQDEEDSPKSYTIDHTVLSYLMDRNGEYLDHLGSSMNGKDLSE